MKDYLAGGTTWIYPHEQQAPASTKILLLTAGGIAVIGHWYSGAVAWHPLPLRNKEKEEQCASPYKSN
jgi:hypothetical protein